MKLAVVVIIAAGALLLLLVLLGLVALLRAAVEAAGERYATHRWYRHGRRCEHCHAVVMSFGPPWLLCQRGRELGGAASSGKPWPGIEDVLRATTGVPAERRN